MRKTIALFSFMALVLCSPNARAETPDPTVQEGEWLAYDVASLKAGEWVEYEMLLMGGAIRGSYRMACVGVDGDNSWIESNQMIALDPARKDMVILYVVDTKTRLITKAFLGKAGEAGKELKVEKTAAGGTDPGTTPKITGFGKVSSEKVKVKDTEFDCEKIEKEQHMEVSGLKFDSRSTTWTSEKLPFRATIDDKKGADPKASAEFRWEGKPGGKGALVKLVSLVNGTKTEITLTGWGADAKKTIK